MIKKASQTRPICHIGNWPAHITAKIVIASAARFTPVLQPWRNNNKIADISFSGGSGNATVQLNDLSPKGGTSNQAFWFVSIIGAGDVTNYPAKFYGAGATNASTNPDATCPLGGASCPSFVPADAPISLPVELIDFTAKKENISDALLNWSTASEHHSNRYELERSLNGQNWGRIGSVKAAGESSENLGYEYLDKVVPGDGVSRIVYYRLKMVDMDEAFTYSVTRSVSFDGKGGVTAKFYPNPATQRVHFSLIGVGSSDGTVISVMDALGREVLRQGVFTLEEDILLDGLAKGVYFVRVVVGGAVLMGGERLVVY